MKELIQLWDYFGINVDLNVPQSPIFWFAVCTNIFYSCLTLYTNIVLSSSDIHKWSSNITSKNIKISNISKNIKNI